MHTVRLQCVAFCCGGWTFTGSWWRLHWMAQRHHKALTEFNSDDKRILWSRESIKAGWRMLKSNVLFVFWCDAPGVPSYWSNYINSVADVKDVKMREWICESRLLVREQIKAGQFLNGRDLQRLMFYPWTNNHRCHLRSAGSWLPCLFGAFHNALLFGQGLAVLW